MNVHSYQKLTIGRLETDVRQALYPVISPIAYGEQKAGIANRGSQA
jgi:hypothetical protein